LKQNLANKFNKIRLINSANKLTGDYLLEEIIDEYISFIKDKFIEATQRIIMKIYLETSVINFLFADKMDAVVSWNLTHIVKFKTKFQVKNINKRLKEKDVIICTPEEMVY